MGRSKNTYSLGAGFDITGQQPIDSRVSVNDINDIYLTETWEGTGLYNGLIVADKNGEVRVLTDRDNITLEKSWRKIDTDFKGIFNDAEEWQI